MSRSKKLSFDILDLEMDIAQNNFPQVEQRILELLNHVDHDGPVENRVVHLEDGTRAIGGGGLLPLTNDMPFEVRAGWCTRLAMVLSQYLSNTSLEHADTFLVHLVIYKSILGNLFYATPYRNMDHILLNRGLLSKQGALQLKTEKDIKYLLACHCLNSAIGFDVKMLATALPSWGMYWYLGLMYGHVHNHNAHIERVFKELTAHHKLIEAFELDYSAVEMMTAPWMLCSYWDQSDRHEIKKSMNRAIEKWVDQQITPGIRKRIADNLKREGPIRRVTVISEKYISKHAMYRCYHNPIVRLRDRFEVTCITAARDIDAKGAEDFDKIIYVDPGVESIVKTLQEVAKTEPDLIIYTSLGMSKWAIPLANVRIARLQIMAYGHPASAFSAYIDYGITIGLPQGHDYQKYIMEKAIPYQVPYTNIAPHADYIPKEFARPNDGVVRIAINSSLQKITSRYINLCALALQHSSVPIEFNFFMIDKREFKNLAFEQSLRERLGNNYRMFDPAPYMEYMENLARCDLALATFPFGGTNSNSDVFLLGIPKLTYNDETDLASFSDEMIMKKFDLPDILYAQSEADLIANLIYLIHDKSLREQIREQILAQDPFKVLYDEPIADTQSTFLGPIQWIEQNHVNAPAPPQKPQGTIHISI